MPGRSKLENTHFWLLGKHCRTQSLCSLHTFLYVCIFTFFTLYSNARRSKLENTHFWFLGEHCWTQSWCSILFIFLCILFSTSYFKLYIFIFLYFVLLYIKFQKNNLEDTCLTSWKTLLDTNFRFNFFNVIFLKPLYFISYIFRIISS